MRLTIFCITFIGLVVSVIGCITLRKSCTKCKPYNSTYFASKTSRNKKQTKFLYLYRHGLLWNFQRTLIL